MSAICAVPVALHSLCIILKRTVFLIKAFPDKTFHIPYLYSVLCISTSRCIVSILIRTHLEEEREEYGFDIPNPKRFILQPLE